MKVEIINISRLIVYDESIAYFEMHAHLPYASSILFWHNIDHINSSRCYQNLLIVIACSKQNESLKSGPVDIRSEFEVKQNFPALTAVYYLTLHDRVVEYKPIRGRVEKVI